MFVHWQPRNWVEARTLLSAGGDGGEGGGSGGTGGQQRLTAAELMARHGASPETLARKLEESYSDNYTLREKNRTLTTEKADLTKQLPPEGAVILTGDDAKAYETYKGFGKPEEIKSRLDEREQLATQVADAKKGETLREVAEVAGYRPAVLKRLGGDLDYILKEETEGEEKVKRAFVKTESGEKPLAEYADTEWPEFKESLLANGGGDGQRQQGGVSFPKQGAGGTGAHKPIDTAKSYVASTYKGPPKRG